MKKVIGFFALAAIILLGSCDIDDVLVVRGEGTLQDFTVETDAVNGILLDLSARVIVKKGNVQSINVRAQENVFDVLTFKNENGVLEIDNEATILNVEPITIEITIPEIVYAFNDSAGDIIFEDYFNPTNLKLTIDGSGDILAKADVSRAEATIDGSGNIELLGTGGTLALIIDGSGDFKGFDFETLTADVLVDGSGRSEVQVLNDLRVSVDGSGDVYYRGNPTLSILDNGSGDVIDAN